MALQTLLETSHLTIAYDHLDDWLLADWHGEQNLETVQHGALEMLRLLAAQRTHKVLNDNRRVTTM